ncbi:hypothetical protein A6033_02120 [Aeromonas veronii]|nr:hypothetical protein A6033_02120 [Aeromonas veronii]POG17884.1 hypothetical protein C2849_16855 [Aeromonas veronii]
MLIQSDLSPLRITLSDFTDMRGGHFFKDGIGMAKIAAQALFIDSDAPAMAAIVFTSSPNTAELLVVTGCQMGDGHSCSFLVM